MWNMDESQIHDQASSQEREMAAMKKMKAKALAKKKELKAKMVKRYFNNATPRPAVHMSIIFVFIL